jgi:hypothetical protein
VKNDISASATNKSLADVSLGDRLHSWVENLGRGSVPIPPIQNRVRKLKIAS